MKNGWSLVEKGVFQGGGILVNNGSIKKKIIWLDRELSVEYGNTNGF
jgi:hypothetical protein